jgi:isopentenyl-diphosphate delta-isomerase
MEQVILVDENDVVKGTMEKMEAHEKALLHRAFSIFIFDKAGKLLMQQRSEKKYHSGGLWTNSCCSHPRPGESVAAAAARRLQEELGFVTPLEKVFDFVYQSAFDNGLTEYEFDHVFVGTFSGTIIPNPAEVAAFEYWEMDTLQSLLKTNPAMFTAWFHIAFPKIQQWWRQQPGNQ